MPSRHLLPFALLALTALAPAQTRLYTVSGAVTGAATTDFNGAPLAASVVEREFTAGTPIALSFGYDPAAPVARSFTATDAVYDAPFAVTGTIGTRRFTANAALVNVVDDTATFPGGTGDLLQFRIDPLLSRTIDGVTDATITEANPFPNSALRLDSFFVQFARRGGGAFTGTAIPGAIDLSRYDANLFLFDYSDGNDITTRVLGSVASVTPVPEPATLAALGLGMVALFRRRRVRPHRA